MSKREPLYDLPISSLGYGCYALSGAYGAKLDEREKVRVLQYAYELGIKYFDTAGSYTGTEEILGKAVQSFRHDIAIASKVGVNKDNMPCLSKASVKSSCEETLKRLRTDYLDVYQVHYHDPNTPVEETIAALEGLKKEGKIKYYGIGHLPLDVTEHYLKTGNVSFALAEMSPVHTSRYKELYPLFKKYSFDIIAFSITGRGLLSGKFFDHVKFKENDIRSKDPLFVKSRFASGIKIAGRLEEIGRKHSMTAAQVAILWTIQHQGILIGLTGPTRIDHLAENSRVINMALDKDSIDEINLIIQEEEDRFRQIVHDEVYTILVSSLPSDYDTAYKDLIYVLEYCIENQIIQYKNGVDIYMKVEDDRRSDRSLHKLNEYRNVLKSYFIRTN